MDIPYSRIKGGVCAPRGFHGSAVSCGIKDPSSDRLDLSLLYSTAPCLSAGAFTQNRVKAAPVRMTQSHLRANPVRAIISNSGNANACTGVTGLADARTMARSTAKLLVPYVQYIHDSVAENKPWDQFTRELVSASGIAWEPGNGAVGYYVRDKGMPLDNMSITMQIFTGERLECAQCHDSPLNKWERMDFFQLAAFTSGQREMNPNIWRQTVNMVDDPDFRRSDLGKIMYWMEDNIHYLTLEDGGDGRIKLPRDYQYRDGDPGEMVGGKTHFGQRISSSARRETKGARQKFANWITTKNDNFDYVIVNRLWGRVMGSPLTLP
ncbi:bifunctional ornithine acetyltransferase/N-acetylglutamate synthase, partial [Akkermansiaceae bacterium]|nr:bifunctional ornithine acetyltransferase/N-acetylglutamate synthase [Akkermansiaceae bacterium]